MSSQRSLGTPGVPIDELRGAAVWLDRMVLKDATLFVVTESNGEPVYRELLFDEAAFVACLQRLGYTVTPPDDGERRSLIAQNEREQTRRKRHGTHPGTTLQQDP